MSGSSYTLRAVADVFVPGPPSDVTMGAADVEAHRFIEHYLEYLLPGLTDVVVGVLDAAAQERAGAPFAALSVEERTVILESLETHEVEQLREIPTLLGLLTMAAVYGEWTGLDEHGALVRPPVGWDMTRFAGPSRGRAHLLKRP